MLEKHKEISTGLAEFGRVEDRGGDSPRAEFHKIIENFNSFKFYESRQ
jgi:hypothetical protein